MQTLFSQMVLYTQQILRKKWSIHSLSRMIKLFLLAVMRNQNLLSLEKDNKLDDISETEVLSTWFDGEEIYLKEIK